MIGQWICRCPHNVIILVRFVFSRFSSRAGNCIAQLHVRFKTMPLDGIRVVLLFCKVGSLKASGILLESEFVVLIFVSWGLCAVSVLLAGTVVYLLKVRQM